MCVAAFFVVQNLLRGLLDVQVFFILTDVPPVKLLRSVLNYNINGILTASFVSTMIFNDFLFTNVIIGRTNLVF